jgi:hypothetical protein
MTTVVLFIDLENNQQNVCILSLNSNCKIIIEVVMCVKPLNLISPNPGTKCRQKLHIHRLWGLHDYVVYLSIKIFKFYILCIIVGSPNSVVDEHWRRQRKYLVDGELGCCNVKIKTIRFCEQQLYNVNESGRESENCVRFVLCVFRLLFISDFKCIGILCEWIFCN